MSGVLVFGAAGSGTSTLGRAVAGSLDWRHVDLDDVLWAPTEPPYTTTNPPDTRARLLAAALDGAPGWVLSGSPGAWTDFLVPRLVLAVFLTAPTALRLDRLERRERGRGEADLPRLATFLAWAGAYDADPGVGRSRSGHEAWIASRAVPVLRLDGTRPVSELTAAVVRGMGSRGLER